MAEESATPDLVEILRRYVEAGNRRDFDAVERFYTPDAVYATQAGTFEGAGAIRGFLEDLMSTFEGFHFEAEELIDLGNGVVFAVIVATGQIPGGSGELPIRVAYVATVIEGATEGLIERLADYTDIDEARVAAERLAEQRDSAMSQENVELVERAIAALNARDIEGYLACCAEDLTLATPLVAVGGMYEGVEGIRRFFADIEDAGPDFLIEIDAVEEVAPAQVIAFVQMSSTGRVSGIPNAAPTTNVYDITHGKISRIRIFFDRDEALKAVGLAE